MTATDTQQPTCRCGHPPTEHDRDGCGHGWTLVAGGVRSAGDACWCVRGVS